MGRQRWILGYEELTALVSGSFFQTLIICFIGESPSDNFMVKFVFGKFGDKVGRGKGFVMVALYAAYTCYIIMR